MNRFFIRRMKVPDTFDYIIDKHRGISAFCYLLFVFLLFSSYVSGQSDEDERSFSVKGYVSAMQTVMYDSLKGDFINDNLLHNRMNFKWYASKDFTLAAEMRNRLFTGDMVRAGNFFRENVDFDPGLLDMSWNVSAGNSYLLNSTLDRLWLDYHSGKVQVTLGRQRINWGQTFVWNPNDLFNVYSYFDVDYEEKPGSDAMRLQYYTSYSSSAELVIKADNDRDITAAGLYRFNKWGYDFQFLAGYFDNSDIVLGTGWSGHIGSLAFRGEASLFHPVEDFPVKNGVLVMTAGAEKIFSDNSMAQIQLMYCNDPVDINNFTSFYYGDISAKNIAYSEFTGFAQFTWAATPLLNISTAAMWIPDLNGFFAGPTVAYSLAENLDFSLIWQYFNSEIDIQEQDINLWFLRIKYSF